MLRGMRNLVGCINWKSTGHNRLSTYMPLVVAAAVIVASTTSASQNVARTPWGDPDLQGMWPSGALITMPFERPVELGTRAELTENEFAQRAADVERQAQASW